MANQENLAEMGRAGRVLDTLAKLVRALAEALHAVRPRQGLDGAGSVLDAFLKETAPSQGAERTLRESGVPVDEINEMEAAQAPQEPAPETSAPEEKQRAQAKRRDLMERRRRKYSTESVWDEPTVTVRSVRNPDVRWSTEDVGDDVLNAMDMLAQGRDTTIQSNALGEVVYPFGKFGKGGSGFLHIVERRMEQGHTLEEAIEIALRVGEAAARGEKTSEQGNIRWLDRNGHRAVVAINENDKPIITGYDIYPKESAGDERMPILPPSNSAPIPPGRKEEVVAALKQIVANIRSARGVRHSTEDVGSSRFSETREGKRIVAALVDNLIAHQADLAFGNEALAERLAQKGNAGVGKWNKVTRVSENGTVLPGNAEELAREEAFRAWQFGRPGGEDLKGLVRACGGAANWLDVVGTAYEVLSAIRSGNLLGGLNKTVAERFGKNEKEAVGWYVQRIVSARATDFGQKCYLMGRKFATDLMREANASAIAELRREYKGKLSEERGKTRKAKERACGLERTAERREANLRAAEASPIRTFR